MRGAGLDGRAASPVALPQAPRWGRRSSAAVGPTPVRAPRPPARRWMVVLLMGLALLWPGSGGRLLKAQTGHANEHLRRLRVVWV